VEPAAICRTNSHDDLVGGRAVGDLEIGSDEM
jgi:hypothetical protein